MKEAIAVLNAGSSSLKFSVYRIDGRELSLVVRGLVEGIGSSPHFVAKDATGKSVADTKPSAERFEQPEAFEFLMRWLTEHYQGVVNLVGVGHRVVHGGAEFIQPTRIDNDVLGKLEKLIPLVPLHQPHNLAGIRAVMRLRPSCRRWRASTPRFTKAARVTERFGLPDSLFQQGLRRWGFHGLSYESIAQSLREIAPSLARRRVIAAHLGSGASLCAMQDGRCVDTTMGFSALDGLPMGTRCGSLDPGVILFLLSEGWTRERLEELLYKKSGLLGISGVSNDVRDLLSSTQPLAADGIDYFIYRIVREIGSLTAALGGLDALVFTAGVGENSPVIRERVCERLEWLNIHIDAQANRDGIGCISAAGHIPAVLVIRTDEEAIIASHTLELIRH